MSEGRINRYSADQRGSYDDSGAGPPRPVEEFGPTAYVYDFSKVLEALAAFPDCPACKGKGEILLLFSSVGCKDCAGEGKVLPPGYEPPIALVAIEPGRPGRWITEEEMLNDEC